MAPPQRLHEAADAGVAMRRDQQMGVIGHQDISMQIALVRFECFAENGQEKSSSPGRCKVLSVP
jgi:hypothetical protein